MINYTTYTTSDNLQIGKAGEHLVCADLILQGYNAFLTDQGTWVGRSYSSGVTRVRYGRFIDQYEKFNI